jgi:ornithine carbamoyltransferase
LDKTKITHPTTTLEDLFMRIVRENTGIEGKSIAYTGSNEVS